MPDVGLEPILRLAGQLTVAGTFLLIIVALINGWLVTRREYARCEQRVAEERKEKEEWKSLALSGTDLAKKAVSAAWSDIDKVLPDRVQPK